MWVVHTNFNCGKATGRVVGTRDGAGETVADGKTDGVIVRAFVGRGAPVGVGEAVTVGVGLEIVVGCREGINVTVGVGDKLSVGVSGLGVEVSEGMTVGTGSGIDNEF